MRLFELDLDSELNTKLVVAADQLKTDLDNDKLNFGMTTDQLLKYFANYDIILDVDDLYNMYKFPPLDKVISNIQGDDIVFKGKEDPEGIDPDQKSDNEKTVEKMAKSALKK